MKKILIYAALCTLQLGFAKDKEWSDYGNESFAAVRSTAVNVLQTTNSAVDPYRSMPRSIICYVDRGLREQEVIRILSMDGGGIRGVIHPIVLSALSQKTGIPIEQMFHYAVGTSAGGIAAVGLQRNTPEKLMEILVEKRKNIFDRRFLSYFGITSNRYHSPTEIFKCVFGNSDFITDDNDDLRCMVTGHNMGTNETILIKNYEKPYFKAYDAASITSAAPIYFPAHTCTDLSGEEHTFVDGGVGANNPILIALNDIQSAHPSARLVVVSIGTGRSATNNAKTGKDLKGAGAIDWVFEHGLLEILMGAPNRLVEREMVERFNSSKTDSLYGVYGRINPGLNSENQSMDSTNRQNVNALMLATLQELVYPAGEQFRLDLQRDGQNRAILANLANQQDLPSTQFSKLALDALKRLDILSGPFQRLVRELVTPKKSFSQMRVVN
jgi:hypothetical protein